MQSRLHSLFQLPKTSSDYSAVLRATVPAVIGILMKLKETSATGLLNYKDKLICKAGYAIEPLRSINLFEQMTFKKIGLIKPEIATVVVGAVIAGLIAETQDDKGNSSLSNIANNMLDQVKHFFSALNREEIIYIVTAIASTLGGELADANINQQYNMDLSGHFKVAINYEMLNSLALRVITRVKQDENQQTSAYSESANAVIWINAALAGVMLAWTADQCHTIAEIGVGIGYGLLLHGAAILLANVLAYYSQPDGIGYSNKSDQQASIMLKNDTIAITNNAFTN